MAVLFSTLIAVICGLASSTPVTLIFNCSQTDGVLWWGCGAFGVCQNGQYSQIDCTNGTVYNRQIRQCVPPVGNIPFPCNKQNVDCTQYVERAGHRVAERDQDTFENRRPCSYYYTCVYGRFAGYQACPEGTVYDEEDMRCNDPLSVPPPCGNGPPRGTGTGVSVTPRVVQFTPTTQNPWVPTTPNRPTNIWDSTTQYPWGSNTPNPPSWGTNTPNPPSWGPNTPNPPSWGPNTPNPPSWGPNTPNPPSWGPNTPNPPSWGPNTPNPPSWGPNTPNPPSWGPNTPNPPSWGPNTQNSPPWSQNYGNSNPDFGQNPSYGGQNGQYPASNQNTYFRY